MNVLPVVLVLTCTFMLTGCTRLRKEAEPVQPVTTTGGQMAEANAPGDDPPAAPLEEQWGVRIERASLSAGGYLVDFRFRVLDPAKATPVLDRAARPYLIDQATGARFIVPNPPKIGQLRSGRTIKKGAVYFVLFANPGKYVKSGNKITVVVGDFRACDIVVQ